eukprot:CAMPEP_0198303042 /NCGR_PEP_ID=MMETSP1449-20131203/56683_1 /TAXON_ID=420275 /ORGANISM="Attheya septentrionalis, Strain CCMP2084" /LENGTH=768 /DNA_ID=CAMNT_0044005525 /DNA_START=247 /DNA_END=2550 /DNA_ORIENTATION=-
MKISVVAWLGLTAASKCVDGAGLRTVVSHEGHAAKLPPPQAGGIVKEDKMFWERLLQGSTGELGPISEAFNEDSDTQTVSKKVDPDTLVLISGDDKGITISPDGTISVDTNVYELPVGQDEVISYTQTVDGVDLPVEVTIRGVNDPPVAQPLVLVQPEQSGPYTLDVLLDATDVDDPNDSLRVKTVTLSNGDGKGVTVPTDGFGEFELDTDEFELEAGERVTSIYDVVITDPNDGTTEITVTLVVVGDNVFEEDSGVKCTDLPDGVTDIKVADSTGLSIINGRLCINTNLPEYELPEGDTITTTTEVCLNEACDETETVVIVVVGVNDPPQAIPIVEQYFEQTETKEIELLGTVTDPDTENVTIRVEVCLDANCNVTEFVVVILNGVNDPPEANPIVERYFEQTDTKEIELLGTVTDPDTPIEEITIISTTQFVGDARGFKIDENILRVDTNVYENLDEGEETVVTFDVTVSDGLAEVIFPVQVTIVGVDDPPTAEPITKTYFENSGTKTFSALENAEDVDGTPRVLTSALASGSTGNPIGITQPEDTFVVDTGKYDLDAGEIETIVYDVSIGDEFDSVPITVTINIVGISGDPILKTVNEDEDTVIIEDLPEDIVRIIIGPDSNPDPEGGVFEDPPVRIDTNKYELPVGDTIEIPVTLCLDENCTNTEPLIITVVGVNDPPVAQPLSIVVPEQSGPYPLNVLLLATDVDNDDSTLLVGTVSDPAGDGLGLGIIVPLDGSSDGVFLLDSDKYDLEEGENRTTIYTVTV